MSSTQSYCFLMTMMSWIVGFIFWWAAVSSVVGFSLVIFGALFALLGVGDLVSQYRETANRSK